MQEEAEGNGTTATRILSRVGSTMVQEDEGRGKRERQAPKNGLCLWRCISHFLPYSRKFVVDAKIIFR